MNTTEILTIILFIAASALCIALIYALYQVVKSVQSISSDIRELSYKLNPVINSARILTEKLIHVTNEVESQLQISETIICDIRDRVDKFLIIEAKIRNGLEDAVMPFIINLKAIRKGVETFWRKYTNR